MNLVKEFGETLIFILEEELASDRVCDGLKICLTNLTAPVHVHLALTGSTSQMSASWFTYGTAKVNRQIRRIILFISGSTATSTVRWSLQSKGPLVGTATGTTSSYLQG